MPNVYLRGRIWWCYVTQGKGRRARVSTHCRDKTAALAVWRQLERRSVTEPDTRPEVTLFDAIRARINERRAAGRAQVTIARAEYAARHVLRLLGAKTLLTGITAAAIDDYIATRLGEGASRLSVAKELEIFRGSLRLAKRLGFNAPDAGEVMPLEFRTQHKPRERALTFEEIAKLLRHCSPKLGAIVRLILATGATYPSEVRKLKREDIDLERWSVRLRGTKQVTRDRSVPIVVFARGWLRDALPDLPFGNFPQIRKTLSAACERAGIDNVAPVDLRRTIATLLRRHGVEPHLIGKFLGHSTSHMAERVYGRLGSDELKELLTAKLAKAGTQLGHTQRKHG